MRIKRKLFNRFEKDSRKLLMEFLKENNTIRNGGFKNLSKRDVIRARDAAILYRDFVRDGKLLEDPDKIKNAAILAKNLGITKSEELAEKNIRNLARKYADKRTTFTDKKAWARFLNNNKEVKSQSGNLKEMNRYDASQKFRDTQNKAFWDWLDAGRGEFKDGEYIKGVSSEEVSKALVESSGKKKNTLGFLNTSILSGRGAHESTADRRSLNIVGKEDGKTWTSRFKTPAYEKSELDPNAVDRLDAALKDFYRRDKKNRQKTIQAVATSSVDTPSVLAHERGHAFNHRNDEKINEHLCGGSAVRGWGGDDWSGDSTTRLADETIASLRGKSAERKIVNEMQKDISSPSKKSKISKALDTDEELLDAALGTYKSGAYNKILEADKNVARILNEAKESRRYLHETRARRSRRSERPTTTTNNGTNRNPRTAAWGGGDDDNALLKKVGYTTAGLGILGGAAALPSILKKKKRNKKK